MSEFNSMLALETQCEKQACDVTPSILEKLTRTRARLSAELANTNKAIEALESNPEIARVLELVGKAVNSRY